MNVQLLGCIELRTDRGDRLPASPSVGALLAVLASSCNTFVSDEDIIDRIWQDAAPVHPRNALYTLATRLRKVLDGARTAEGTGEVTRRRGGYVLVIDAASVDACRFRTLVRQARSAVSQGEDERALSQYEEALSLWHGDPLSGVRTGWADGIRVTLRHEWRAAVLNSAEVGLRLNRHDDYLPQLHELASLHPLDEKVAGLLMLALHRSGRQDEALGCFHRIRSELVDGLGDEPGPDLRDLHERILRRDDGIRTGRPAPHALVS
ncbi:AfsR/SARP family transcriptional regulator [Streptomyces sp. NPDC001935]